MELEGKVALILGAARGIGRAYTDSLLQKGAKVSFCDVRDEDGKQSEDELREKYGHNKVWYRHCDCTKYDDLERFFNDTLNHFGTIDIVVCNIGILNEKKWKESVMINLCVPIMAADITQYLLGKDKGGRGAIFVCTASIAAHRLIYVPVYAAAKAGLVHYIRSASVSSEYQRHGIKMIALCPDTVKTQFLPEHVTPATVRYYDIVRQNSQKHLENCLSPHQIGEALVHSLENPKLGPGAVVSITNDGIHTIHHSSP